MVDTLLHKVKEKVASARRTPPTPDLQAWREVGWIFRDGEVVAIEREGTATRSRRVEPD